ncbi:MAG TPA: hypothetical protein PKE69_02390 [Pyrinomonadaceae bacterium]|nr:hypothetical protein [Pyrinomonadaceae bacterium]
MRTVIELPEFIHKAEKLFGIEEREKIVELLSANPNLAKKIENFGGIRKLEWTHHGKKTKEHNIYYHAGAKNLPLIIIGIFSKHEKMIFDKIVEILIYSKLK